LHTWELKQSDSVGQVPLAKQPPFKQRVPFGQQPMGWGQRRRRRQRAAVSCHPEALAVPAIAAPVRRRSSRRRELLANIRVRPSKRSLSMAALRHEHDASGEPQYNSWSWPGRHS
jgi:hypothetical protein